jgi:hypothetical protein
MLQKQLSTLREYTDLYRGIHNVLNCHNAAKYCKFGERGAIVQLGYLEVAVQEKLRSGWPGPFVKVEGCCD